MIKRELLGAVLCLLLATMMLWQGSSCKSTRANLNSARSDNQSMSNDSTRQNTTDLKGTWGGDHISMDVADSGAEINYDCAHGSITEKIVPDGRGAFVAKGLHVTERPGPVRQGDDLTGKPATYRGSVDGDTMKLTVTLSGSEETVGSFTLTHGKTGRVRKCA
jgi:hypothetical protein